MATPALFGLPQLPEADFQRLAALAGDNIPQWTDVDGDTRIEPGEISSAKSSYVTVKNGKAKFTPAFEKLYRGMAETYRQERVARELTLSYVEPIHTDFGAWLRNVPASVGLTDAEMALYKAGLAALLAAAPHLQRAFDDSVGFKRAQQQEFGTANDAELISRYSHPWCVGDQSDWCVALPSLAARTSGVIATGVACEQITAQPKTLGVHFHAVVRNRKGQLVAVPYAQHFAATQRPATEQLRKAAALFAQIPREQALATYLLETAKAFESTKPYPYLASDAAWHQHGASDSLLYVRVGPDETGSAGVGSPCGNKALHHMRIGLKNFAMLDEGARYQPYVQGWEDRYAQLIDDPTRYVAQKVVVKMPEFWDIIFENGDALGDANGNVIGQSLPNWCGADGLAKPCPRRTMIFSNKELRTYSTQIMSQYILPLFDPKLHAEFQREIGQVGTVLHELAHNLGPQQGKPKPGSDIPYDEPLQKWAGTMEELKAQNASLDLAGQLFLAAREQANQGKISPQELTAKADWYRTVIMRSLGWSARMVIRATRNGKFEGTAYSKLSAVQLGVLTEEGAISWDTQGKYWHVDFSHMPQAAANLTQKVLQLYAEGDFATVDAFMTNYLSGAGFKLLHVDRLQEVAGTMPSAVFDYEVDGL